MCSLIENRIEVSKLGVLSSIRNYSSSELNSLRIIEIFTQDLRVFNCKIAGFYRKSRQTQLTVRAVFRIEILLATHWNKGIKILTFSFASLYFW